MNRARLSLAFLAGLVAAAFLVLPAGAGAGTGTIAGRVEGAGAGSVFEVEILTTGGGSPPRVLDSTRTGPGGRFRIRRVSVATGTVRYLVAKPISPGSHYRLATVFDPARAMPRQVVINDRTTVAAAFAMAQFIDGGEISGRGVGLYNSAQMTSDLATARTGAVAPVLARPPNGTGTSTLATFDSLANLSAACRSEGPRCAQLLRLTRPDGGAAPADSFEALGEIATDPSHNAEQLFRLSRQVAPRYRPTLSASEAPDAWTLALRFEGTPETVDGPGNFAIDRQGNIWVLNNYEYSRNPPTSVCGSEQLLRFTPTGAPYPGSPYEGGGLSGAGFGISFDPAGRLWVGNFGFSGEGCEVKPPHDSVSLFSESGEPISPPGGYTQGKINWAQGLVSDREGNVWIANCGNDSATLYPEGKPGEWQNFSSGLGMQKPFGLAVGSDGRPFFTSNGNSAVVALEPDGTPVPGSPITGGGINRPLGIAVDSGGNMWVADSGKIIAPCTGEQTKQSGPETGAVTLIRNGRLAGPREFANGGLVTPWGIAVDGDDHVWVANFGGKRVAELCGIRTSLCPPGHRRTGAPISPTESGYGFDGLVRSTGIAIDPSGNVWVTNNWKSVPVQTNPGGYQIVAFLGLAAPVKTPLIGPPQRP